MWLEFGYDMDLNSGLIFYKGEVNEWGVERKFGEVLIVWCEVDSVWWYDELNGKFFDVFDDCVGEYVNGLIVEL